MNLPLDIPYIRGNTWYWCTITPERHNYAVETLPMLPYLDEDGHPEYWENGWGKSIPDSRITPVKEIGPEPPAAPSSHPRYVGVSHGLRGWFAVLLWWNPSHGGFYEPECSGIYSFVTKEEVGPGEGIAWAKSEGIEFRG